MRTVGILVSLALVIGATGVAKADETVKITSIVSGKVGNNVAILIKFDVTGTANTEYQVRLDAVSPTGAVTFLNVQPETTLADGKKSSKFGNNATTFVVGTKY